MFHEVREFARGEQEVLQRLLLAIQDRSHLTHSHLAEQIRNIRILCGGPDLLSDVLRYEDSCQSPSWAHP